MSYLGPVVSFIVNNEVHISILNQLESVTLPFHNYM